MDDHLRSALLLLELPGRADLPGRWALLVGYLVLLLVESIALWRLLTAGLVVDARGVLIRGFIRVRRFDWSEVSAFEVWEVLNALSVRTTDGRRHVVHGVAGLNPGLFPRTSGRIQQAADDLNVVLDRYHVA